MKNFWKNIPKKFRILIVAISILFLIIFFIPNPMNGHVSLLTRIINALSGVNNYGFSYEVYGYDEDSGIYNIILSFENPDGVKDLYDHTKDTTIYANGRSRVSIDYQVEDFTDYKFDITLQDGTVKNETFHFERTRYGKDTYKNVKGVFANTPNLEGYEKELTRYLKYNDDGVLQPGNWITDEEPINWYDYNAKDSEGNQSPKWANIFVEYEGLENFLVWIPRYCYKMPENNTSGNERVDIKFIDVFNNYESPEEGKLTWDELKAFGYKIPEAFEFGTYKESSLSGYWISKYELSGLEQYAIDYKLTASKLAFNVTNLTKNTEKEVAKYTFAINGKVESHQPTDIEDHTFTNGTPDVTNTINVTALDSDGRIVGSMTKKVELADANEPDLTGFDPYTTFYVYWDNDGNEHNEIPITQAPPDGWYNYTYSQWANIVTRNNGLENYLVWIPRYQYRLNGTNETASIKFIKGTGTDTEVGYKIPEAFTWQTKSAVEAIEATETQEGREAEEAEYKELTGYWISKYELSTEAAENRIEAELAVGDDYVSVKDIKGTLITEAQENSTALKIEYYVDANKVHDGTDVNENYRYTGLRSNTTYTINIIVREKNSNKYVGAITHKVKIVKANAPQFDGFNTKETDDEGNKLPVAYYVLYDNSGNMTIGNKVKTDGSNMPSNWYDYANRKWANIVVTDGDIQGGQIQNATVTNYLVWIPRYEYRIDTSKTVESLDNKRVDINFIEGTGTDTSPDYKIPEAFTWTVQSAVEATETEEAKEAVTKELLGYWISKYELSE